ncbi:ABC transporter permease [Acholeplasma granularum]|uniref:ABC transporter permease n=1 Tax=Acholeplasma granularum TaxID=264635 RepID=UPI0004725252|nr:ABC transporter permease [Acholeplasma granularum]
MIEIIQLAFVSIIPLLVVALGGLMSEKSGVTNIALEGLMLLGAFFGTWTIRILQLGSNPPPQQIIFFIGILVGGITGGLFSLAHAFASIKLNADQTISATAINLFATAFAIFTARSVLGGQQVKFNSVFRIDKVPFLGDIPLLGEIFFQKTYISFYLAIGILVFIWVLLYKTKSGLRIRAVGENPQAADAQGINIYKIRYLSVLASGILAGIGGLIFVVTTSESFDATVAGMGFLSIAVLIFGNWHPGRILLSAIFFGLFRTIASAYSIIPFLKDLVIPREFYQMLPFVITLVVLAFTSRNSRAPKSLGQIYEMGKR